MPTLQVPAVARLQDIKVFRPFADAKPWRDGKLRGAVKSGNDKYHVAETMLNDFRDGESCDVEFKTFGGKDGKEPAREIVKKIGGMGPQQPKQITRPATSSRDSEQIFVTALLKEYIAAGMIPADTDSVVKAVAKLRAAYAMTFGGVQAQTRDDLDDQIPY